MECLSKRYYKGFRLWLCNLGKELRKWRFTLNWMPPANARNATTEYLNKSYLRERRDEDEDKAISVKE